MQTNNLSTSSCQDDVFRKKHDLIKKICVKVEDSLDIGYRIADSEKPEFKLIYTFCNRAYKGKSYLLKDLFKSLFEEDLDFLKHINRTTFILSDLKIRFYLFK